MNFNFSNLGIRFADETDGVLQHKGFGGHSEVDGVSGGIQYP